jgi:hypothetical protein
MPENDNSRPLEDQSGRKTTSRGEGINRKASFFAQSSALSPYLSRHQSYDEDCKIFGDTTRILRP